MPDNPALSIFLGTAACSAGVLIERRRRGEIFNLVRRLEAVSEEHADDGQASVAYQRRLEHLRDSFRVIGIDVDGVALDRG